MRTWLTAHGVGQERFPTLAFILAGWTVVFGVAVVLRLLAVPDPVVAGAFFSLAVLALLPIAEQHYDEPYFRSPGFRLFKPVLDWNFTLGYVLFALTVGVAAGVVGTVVL